MIEKNIAEQFNEQIKHELESAYLYLAMANWFKAENFDGMASWMTAQATEEMGHAARFQNHLIDRDARVQLQSLSLKKTEWKSPLEAFQDALEHERFITGRINRLVETAYESKDRAARTFLEWFVTEQIEEEATASKIVTDLERIGDFGYGLVMLDRELGQRQLQLPVLEAE